MGFSRTRSYFVSGRTVLFLRSPSASQLTGGIRRPARGRSCEQQSRRSRIDRSSHGEALVSGTHPVHLRPARPARLAVHAYWRPRSLLPSGTRRAAHLYLPASHDFGIHLPRHAATRDLAVVLLRSQYFVQPADLDARRPALCACQRRERGHTGAARSATPATFMKHALCHSPLLYT